MEEIKIHWPDNDEVDQFLLKKKVLPLLEESIQEHIKQYYELENLNDTGKLDFGNHVSSSEDAFQIFDRMKVRMAERYGLRMPTDPEIAVVSVKEQGLGRSEEDYGDRCITMVMDRVVRFETTLIHGYVHFIVEVLYGYLGFEYACVEEGLAMEVSEEMAEYLSEVHRDKAYRYDLMEDTLSNLWECYCWLVKELKHKKNSKLVKNYPFEEGRDERVGRKPDQYARGSSYFKVHGKMNRNHRLVDDYLQL